VTRPVFVVVCGINGAGKSTLADALAGSPELAILPFLNPDRLSADYRVADPALSREAADIRALRHIAGEIRRLLAARQSFVSETVGANAAYRRYVEAAKTAGYLVRVVFVGLRSAEQSIVRVALRVSLGGHSIPTPDIRRRWPAVHVNLTWFATHADILDVYANAEDGAAPRIISRVRAGRIEMLDAAALPAVTEALASLPR
jgi:predicted ABC-type ATPase